MSDLVIPPLDPSSREPLHRQLYGHIREAILTGRLPSGSRLPPSRTLQASLGVSRNTVLGALDQLIAEGYVEGRVGAGTFVSAGLEPLVDSRPQPVVASPRPVARTSAWSRALATIARSPDPDNHPVPFRPCIPAVGEVRVEAWGRLAVQHWRCPGAATLNYDDPAGHAPLRAAIAEHIGRSRAVHCDPGQVIVVNGSQQALYVAARVLLDPGDEVWIEDPAYAGARRVLQAAGARLVPVPVDGEGLQVADGIAQAPSARLAYVTPSHQFPTGASMSLARRLALLDWAQRSGAWVLEDDYDSEYRYEGHPLPALQGLDRGGRVIYIGTFSKVLFPALRIGYLVVAPELVDAMVAAKELIDTGTTTPDQAILARFVREGHFARHLRHMRTLHGRRRACLIEHAGRALAGRLELSGDSSGLHLVGWLAAGVSDLEASARAAQHGIVAPPLSGYALRPQARGGLVLGFAPLTEEQIREGVGRLAAALA